MMRQGAGNLVRRFSRLAAAAETAAAAPRMPAFDHVPLPYDGPSAAEIARKRAEYLSPSLFHFYSKPLNIVEGKRQYLYDEHGRRYLDAFAGIATVCCGHCHPDVVDAITAQARRLQHSTVLYLNHAIADFAEALASKLPGDLKVVFFTNSGTEANELAILMARLYTGSHDIISLRNSYHGNAAGTMGATAQKNWKFNVVQRRLRLRRREVRARRAGDHRVRHHRPGRRLHIRSHPGCRWDRGGVAGVPAAGVREGPEGRRALHRRRGPGGVRSRRQPLLGVRDPRRRPRHCDHGQGHRQRHPPGRRGDDAGDRAGADPPLLLQHFRRQPAVHRGRARRAQGAREGEAPGERLRHRLLPQGPPPWPPGEARNHRRREGDGLHARRRARDRPPAQDAGQRGDLQRHGTHERYGRLGRERRVLWERLQDHTPSVLQQGRC
ncbi:uncharacterized protein LOC120692838 isoform X2 [Panicum virgatum]|uniref:uncharacterized protein LOC120692838 isoform X2 n=1 Tax=Panicum virgatum TaxID=38727 RepID=UPI0019D55DBE|nr:uncharacterized protein LOC120692838 isoform X2 [Panicum virgatum]